MPSIPPWFSGAKLNWAENMLAAGRKTPDKVAVVECGESTHSSVAVALGARSLITTSLLNLTGL